jgi:hypothetical protein
MFGFWTGFVIGMVTMFVILFVYGAFLVVVKKKDIIDPSEKRM